jgi:hypothetical protein
MLRDIRKCFGQQGDNINIKGYKTMLRKHKTRGIGKTPWDIRKNA